MREATTLNPMARPVLIVEDSEELLEALCDTLRVGGYAVHGARSVSEALGLLDAHDFGLIVSDVQMQPLDGFALLRSVKSSRPLLPVIMMTAYGEVAKAVEAMRYGAADYLLKPFEAAALLAQAARYLAIAPRPADECGMVAVDPRSRALLTVAQRVAASAATVLITGESGSGKEVLARYLHVNSPRADQPFVAVNCAAIPDNLLEATMFGFEKGAFTGAVHAQAGKLEQAQKGTLLLDEVSEMPLALQAKLLRVLQEREVERVGGSKSLALDIRVIATSNRDLPAEVAKGNFREDLYYRLNVFPLEIPPLRERIGDIVPLARELLARYAARAERGSVRLTPEAEARLQAHTWPGNVRELENVLQRALILAHGDEIGGEDLQLAQPSAVAEVAAGAPAVQPAAPASRDMKSLERNHILDTLAAVNGSRKLAVQRLGISERTLRYKLQQYRLAGAI